MKLPKDRIVYLDYLRAFSIIGVIVVHCAILAVNHFGEVPAASWWFGVLTEIFARSAVPIFIMIAGALALQSQTASNLTLFMQKKFARLLGPTIAYFILYGWWSLHTHQVTDIKTYLIKTFVYGVPYNHLYFIFVIFGLYLFTPFIKRMVENLTFKEYSILLIIIFTLTGIWDFSAAWFTRNWTTAYLFSSSFFIPFLGYYLAGDYFHRYSLNFLKPKFLIFLFVLSSITIVVGEYFFVSRFGINARGLITHNYQGILVLIQGISLFLLSKHFSPKTIPLPILSISKASFGMYLIHQIIIDIQVQLFHLTYINLTISWIILLFILTTLLSYLIPMIISRISIIKTISGLDR